VAVPVLARRDYTLLRAVARIVYALPVRGVTVEHDEHPETRAIGVVVRMPRHWGHSQRVETALADAGYDVQARTTTQGTEMWVTRHQ
jgi:hypothetical protein